MSREPQQFIRYGGVTLSTDAVNNIRRKNEEAQSLENIKGIGGKRKEELLEAGIFTREGLQQAFGDEARADGLKRILKNDYESVREQVAPNFVASGLNSEESMEKRSQVSSENPEAIMARELAEQAKNIEASVSTEDNTEDEDDDDLEEEKIV